MRALLESVKIVEAEEYERAKVKFGAVNNSSHESYAVIKEELEETEEALNFVNFETRDYWTHVRRNETTAQEQCLRSIERNALFVACEAIQVAAMAHKAILTLEAAKE